MFWKKVPNPLWVVGDIDGISKFKPNLNAALRDFVIAIYCKGLKQGLDIFRSLSNTFHVIGFNVIHFIHIFQIRSTGDNLRIGMTPTGEHL